MDLLPQLQVKGASLGKRCSQPLRSLNEAFQHYRKEVSQQSGKTITLPCEGLGQKRIYSCPVGAHQVLQNEWPVLPTTEIGKLLAVTSVCISLTEKG